MIKINAINLNYYYMDYAKKPNNGLFKSRKEYNKKPVLEQSTLRQLSECYAIFLDIR